MPSLGRFASADAKIPNFANPQPFNRYVYTANNPIRLIDPSGHLFWDVVDVAFWAKSAYDFYHEPSWGNAGWLALDTVSLIPVVPSVGWIKYGDEAIDVAVRVVNQVSDAGQAANQAVNAVEGVARYGDDLASLASSSDEVSELGANIYLFNYPGKDIPATRPGGDGRVSCSCLNPVEGFNESLGRPPTPGVDNYWRVDIQAVQHNGGQLIYDGGATRYKIT